MLRSEWDVLPFLESGKLVRVLPEYAQSANIWAVTGAALSQHEITCLCDFWRHGANNGWASPTEAIRS